MDITISVRGASEEFAEKLLAFLAPYRDTVTVEDDSAWTPDRIARYFLALPPRAQRILEEAVSRGGYVSSDALRGDDGAGSLKGHSAGLKRILDRGIREGWWPATLQLPVQAQGPGFGKVLGYKIPEPLHEAFRDVVLTLPTTRGRTLATEITRHDPDTPWDPDLARTTLTTHGLTTDPEAARTLLRHLADTGLLTKTRSEQPSYRLVGSRY
ncbi:hypothetical protein [Kitasatospora sp. NPDC097643]|uniref:hypothetical protein n=1 Tax=Kitasatospora sp. NPDC097643 TaxID=3157230 RepID=UPI00332D0023